MTWANFYLICFVVGFAFSLISFLSGGTRWHFHLPHGHGHLPAVGHVPVAGHGPSLAGAHGAGAHATVGTQSGIARGASQAANDVSISPFNFVTFTAFLAWFGGTGYLLTRYSGLWFLVGLGLRGCEWHRGRWHRVLVSTQSADLRGRASGSGGLRDGWRAGANVDSDS